MSVKIIEAPSIPLPTTIDADAVVLPREVSDKGVGLYDDSVITIVKELRVLGVEASFQHDSGSRSWIGEKSVAKIVIDLVIGIGSSGGWAALCRLFSGPHKDDHVRVRVGRFRQHEGTTSSEWYEVEGTGDAVAKAMAQIEAPGRSGEEEEQKALEN